MGGARERQQWRARLPAAQRAASAAGAAGAGAGARAALEWAAAALARGGGDDSDAPWKCEELWVMLGELARTADARAARAPAPLPAGGVLSAAASAFAAGEESNGASDAAAAALRAMVGSEVLRQSFRPATEHVVRLAEAAFAPGAHDAAAGAAASVLTAHAGMAAAPRKLFERFVDRLLMPAMRRRERASQELADELDAASRAVLFHRAHLPGFAAMQPAFQANPADGGGRTEANGGTGDGGGADDDVAANGGGRPAKQRKQADVDATAGARAQSASVQAGYQRALFSKLAESMVAGDAAAAAAAVRLLAEYSGGAGGLDGAAPPPAAVVAFMSRIAQPALLAMRRIDGSARAKGGPHATADSLSTATLVAQTLARLCEICRGADAYSHAHALAREGGPHARCVAEVAKLAVSMHDSVLLGAHGRSDCDDAVAVTRAAAAALAALRAALLLDHRVADGLIECDEHADLVVGSSRSSIWDSLLLAAHSALTADVQGVGGELLAAAQDVACGYLDTARERRSLGDFVTEMLESIQRQGCAGCSAPSTKSAIAAEHKGKKRARESRAVAASGTGRLTVEGGLGTPTAIRALLCGPKFAMALRGALHEMLGAQAPVVAQAAVAAAGRYMAELAILTSATSDGPSRALVSAEVIAMCLDGVRVDAHNAAGLQRECSKMLGDTLARVLGAATAAAARKERVDSGNASPGAAELVFSLRLFVAASCLKGECTGWLSTHALESEGEGGSELPSTWASVAPESSLPLGTFVRWAMREHGGADLSPQQQRAAQRQLAFALDGLALWRMRDLQSVDAPEAVSRESCDLCEWLIAADDEPAKAGEAGAGADAAMWMSAPARASPVIVPPFTGTEYAMARQVMLEAAAHVWSPHANAAAIDVVAQNAVKNLARGAGTAASGSLAQWPPQMFEVPGLNVALARHLVTMALANACLALEEVDEGTCGKARAKLSKHMRKELKGAAKALNAAGTLSADTVSVLTDKLDMGRVLEALRSTNDRLVAPGDACAFASAIFECAASLPRGFIGDSHAAAALLCAAAACEGAFALAGAPAVAVSARRACIATLHSAVANARAADVLAIDASSSESPVCFASDCESGTLLSVLSGEGFAAWLVAVRGSPAVDSDGRTGKLHGELAEEGCRCAAMIALARPGDESCCALLRAAAELHEAGAGGEAQGTHATLAAAGAMAGLAERVGGDPRLRRVLAAARVQQEIRGLPAVDYALPARSVRVHELASKLDASVATRLSRALIATQSAPGSKEVSVDELAAACKAAACVLRWRLAHMQCDVDDATLADADGGRPVAAGTGAAAIVAVDGGTDGNAASADGGEVSRGAGSAEDDDEAFSLESDGDEPVAAATASGAAELEAAVAAQDAIEETALFAIGGSESPCVATLGTSIASVLTVLTRGQALPSASRDALYDYLAVAMEVVVRIRPLPPPGAFSTLVAAHVVLVARCGPRAFLSDGQLEAEVDPEALGARASLRAMLSHCRTSQLRLAFNALSEGLATHHRGACLACLETALAAATGGRAIAVAAAAGRIAPALLAAARESATGAQLGAGDSMAVSVARATVTALSALASKRSVVLGVSEVSAILSAPCFVYAVQRSPSVDELALALRDNSRRAEGVAALFDAAAGALRAALRFRRAETRRQAALVREAFASLLRVLDVLAAAALRSVEEDTASGPAAWRVVTSCANSLRGAYAEVETRKDTFSKYAPHMLSDLLDVLVGPSGSASLASSPSGNGPTGAAAALREGAFCLLSTCSTRELAQAHATYGSQTAAGAALQGLRTEWQRTHKYTGKV